MKPLKSIAEDMSIIMKCNETSAISKRTLNMALIEKSIERPIDKNFKCFLHCLYNNYDWMENNGEFRHDNMKSGLTESTLVDRAIDYLINTCTKISEYIEMLCFNNNIFVLDYNFRKNFEKSGYFFNVLKYSQFFLYPVSD